MTHPYAIVLHGGAGARKSKDYTAEVKHMAELVEAARDQLKTGAVALDVVTEVVRALEASGLYVAGKGSSPNINGIYELDAAIMDGQSRKAGAVAALVGYESPIDVARGVMGKTPHVLLAGDGAAEFADAIGYATVTDPDGYYTKAGKGEDNHPPGTLAHGTVGCVVLDQAGNLAAGTSTGGVFGKLPGRVGDTPIIGAGCYADDTVAVSCTGQGEFFLRGALAYDVAARMRYGEQTLAAAADAAIHDTLTAFGGDGGMITVDRQGNIAMPYNSQGMKRAWCVGDGEVHSAAFELEVG